MKKLLVATVVVAVFAVPAAATIVAPTELREVITSATVIVRGRVTDVRAVAGAGREIDTVATIAVRSVGVLKGAPVDFVSVRVPGGTIGRSKFVMVGAPVITVGEDAVWFLKRGSLDALWPVGLSMGVYRVKPDLRTGLPVVDPPNVPGQTVQPGRLVRGDPTRKSMAVAEFESLVRLLVAAAR